MATLLVAIAVLLVLAVASTNSVNYEGYKVYQVHPSGTHQLETLLTLKHNSNLDFWSPIRKNEAPVNIMVKPTAQDIFVKFLEEQGIRYELKVQNVEKLVQEERALQLISPRAQLGGISFTQYYRHAEINAYLDQLTIDRKEIVSLETIGTSYEGRELKTIKVSTDPSANKPVILIDAGIHAREWIAPALALYIINQIVENPENANLLEKVDWHVLPVLNPDGYEYSHTSDRYWRKTRSPNTSPMCAGTDGNRNFDYHWAEIGASPYECYDDYHGPAPFSESETAALRDYVLRNRNSIKLYITLHSAGPYILYPWGWTSALPEDSPELHALGSQASEAIAQVNGTEFEVGSSTNALYPAAGGSDDWVKAIGGVNLSYTIELPPGGPFRWDPLPHEILPMVKESWVGIKVFHDYIADKFGNGNNV